MPNKFSFNKLHQLYQLTRMHAPTGYLLLFFPASFGLLLAYEQKENLFYLPIFLIGSIIIRSAGCIINDLMDRNIDKHVERTKNRPLASGAVSPFEALVLLAILLSIALLILLSLTITAVYIGMIAMVFITLYPLMKRITYFPQIFLGITFNMGCLIGYATIQNTISYNALILYASCAFWTIAYDTIYGFMDLEDDKKIGVKSTARFFENYPFRLIITIFYVIFFLMFILASFDIISIYLGSALVLSFFIMLWITVFLDIKNRKGCMNRFKANNYIGFLLFLAMLLEKM